MIHSEPITPSVDSCTMASTASSSPSSSHLSTFPQLPEQQLRTAPYSESIQSETSRRRVRFTFGYDEEDTQSPSSEEVLPTLPSYTESISATAETRPDSPTAFPSMRIIAPSTYDTLIASDNDTFSSTLPATPTSEATPVTNTTSSTATGDLTTDLTTDLTVNNSTESHPSLPALSDLVSPIPLRTSSMTSFSTFVPSIRTPSPTNSTETLPPVSSSRCSSMNSAVSATWSLDHRTMPRTPVSASKRPSSSASYASFSSRSTEKALPSLPYDKSDYLTQRRPSVAERTAFLASAPIRSTLSKHSRGNTHSHHYHQQPFARSTPSLPARFKNMSPISSISSASSTSRATVSSPTLSLSTFSAMHLPLSLSRPIRTTVPLEKRRWSNDSTRGIHGLALLEGADADDSSVESSSFLEDEIDEDAENGSDYDFKKAHSVHGYNSYTNKKLSSKPKKTKKKCVVLSTFESLLKKQ
ncbi:hypothetical protein EMPS_02051 [Entomortierella parvispora]|uniref:Uncharacterized protein n=1 Tax=Entomortierella parvispora TaxID=205924 RepID=A0A9P3H4Q4_9FUNG|nr:hypothetical protein EMPS_02051 [Entomortierella parvispora]